MTTHADRCPECDDTGYRDIKSPDDTSGYTHCLCPAGRAEARRERERWEQDLTSEQNADLPW